MNYFAIVPLTALFLVASLGPALSQATADDQVRMRPTGSAKGTISLMTSTEIALDMAAGQKKQIPVNEIDAVIYEGEPPEIKLVRSEIANDNFEAAAKKLDKIDAAKITRAEIKQDIAFYKALCHARLALAGNGDVRKAGSQMWGFVKENSTNYHYLQGVELLGDLFAANRSLDEALQQYAIVERAPWPEYKTRAGIAKGQVLVLQKKYPEALAAFESVMKQLGDDNGKTATAQKLAAQLGKANCLAATGEADTALQLVQQVIDNADPEDVDLSARAYLTLGNCYRQKKDSTTDAYMAYLHVDLLYSKNREAHAEALSNLARLCNDMGKPERALQAAQTLKDRYANSIWARQ